jgi:hypothetical protein
MRLMVVSKRISIQQRRYLIECGRFVVAFFALIILTIQEGTGQYYLIGDDPASVRWRQIKTKNFKVIYPNTWEKQGQYIASGLEYVYIPEGKSLYHFTPRTPVIIHTQTTNPTSDTYIAPRRMDYFTAPPQDIYPQDWVDQLIIHEFRHAVQYSAVNCGVTKALSYVLGEQGVLAVFGLFLPIWFIEGDATVAETAFHNTGRGRTPSFEMRLRAQLVQKGIYPYEKANYGSYRDFVPGKYELGYQLVGLSRINFGSSIWSDVLNNVGRRPYTLVPFSSAIKRQTGLNKYQLYNTQAGKIQKNWLEEDKLIKENNYKVITGSAKKLYTNYNLPVVFRDSMTIAVKSSIDNLTKVVLLSREGKEKNLFTVGANYFSESLTASDSVIYWSELVNDPRWLLRDYRVIKSYSFDTGKTKQLTHLTRYYAPSVTSDGKYIAAVEVNTDNKYFLVILNSIDGSIIRRISTPDNLLFIHPRWSEDGKQIVSVVFGKAGNNISVINPESGKAEILMPYSLMEMKRPSFFRNYILYTSSYNGKDNIYALDPRTKQIFRVTSARFGASDGSVTNDGAAIIYSNYTADGYELVKEKLDTTLWNKISVPQKSAFPLAEKLTEQENFIFNADSVPEIQYDSKPYSKLLNLFNFHSWAPVGIDLQNFSAAPGVTFLSQNLLGTTVSALGYLYNRNERTGRYYISVSDESLYPAIDFNMDYGGRKDIGIYTKNDTVPGKWSEFNLSAGLRLPLNWSHNSWIRSFQPAVSMNYKYLKMDKSVPFRFEHDQIVAVRYSLIASNTLKTSHRDILPRWSQLLQLNFDNAPFIRNSSNSLFAGQVTMDFPGIDRHHGLRLYGGYQIRKEDFYPFSDLIIFPRGYTEIARDEISSFSLTYSMPLFYPEWQIGNLMYFKRFKTALFYDFAKSTDQLLPSYFSSVGLDLTSDFALFNFIAPFDAGLRSIYNPETGKIKFELLFSLNFGGMY